MKKLEYVKNVGRKLKVYLKNNMKKISRLHKKYLNEIKPTLIKELEINNNMAAPFIEKIVVNMGVGAAIKNKEVLEHAKRDLASITGQFPSTRMARVSVASFGVRKGMAVGLKVTLRKENMYIFLDKLISIVLPRLRDFRGVSQKSFDKSGNYTLGMVEHTVFPEIDLSKSTPRGLEITIVVKSKKPEWSLHLLKMLGFPFEKKL